MSAKGLYILKGKRPVRAKSVAEWASWFEKSTEERTVKVTEIDAPGKPSVSTVFIGLDHSFGGDVPILFETMIFGGKHDGDQYRYTTWEEAEQHHDQLVKDLSAKNTKIIVEVRDNGKN